MTAALSPVAPTAEAARARLAAVEPAEYARSRNAIDGAATGLSPYITHGFLTLPEVVTGVSAAHALGVQDKLVFELGWREFFRHVWRHRGDAIFESLHAGPLPEAAYAREMPADLREARTGVPAIDEAVRTLHATGLLHNHARLWLASYCVHLRRIHWRTGADWLYAHLLDGDLASNHLSWQWVAGTGSRKPYLFNAENVARFAPAAWHSPGSAIDRSYEELGAIACGAAQAIAPPRHHAPADVAAAAEPALHGEPPPGNALTNPDAGAVRDRDVWLIHPWALRAPPADLAPDTVLVAVCIADFHRRWPWSERRWRFVLERMRSLAPCTWFVERGALAEALRRAKSVRSASDPHIDALLEGIARLDPTPALFADIARPCSSFSQWWTRATSGIRELDELPGLQPRSKTLSST